MQRAGWSDCSYICYLISGCYGGLMELKCTPRLVADDVGFRVVGNWEDFEEEVGAGVAGK